MPEINHRVSLPPPTRLHPCQAPLPQGSTSHKFHPPPGPTSHQAPSSTRFHPHQAPTPTGSTPTGLYLPLGSTRLHPHKAPPPPGSTSTRLHPHQAPIKSQIPLERDLLPETELRTDEKTFLILSVQQLIPRLPWN